MNRNDLSCAILAEPALLNDPHKMQRDKSTFPFCISHQFISGTPMLSFWFYFVVLSNHLIAPDAF